MESEEVVFFQTVRWALRGQGERKGKMLPPLDLCLYGFHPSSNIGKIFINE